MAKQAEFPQRPNRAPAKIRRLSFTRRARRASPKGFILNTGNLDHMLSCTTARLDRLMKARPMSSMFSTTCRLATAGSGSAALLPFAATACSPSPPNSLKLKEELALANPQYF